MEKIQLTFGSNLKSYEIGDIVYIAKNQALTLSSGVSFNDVPVAFQSYGKLNSDKSNAILLCHALTGDQYAASDNPVTGKEGWWSFMIGPGKPIDTNKYFVICANVLGGCMGTLGPTTINAETGKRHDLDFPVITIGDMVKLQKAFIEEHLGISKLFGVIGGSMGGMLVLEWLSKYPEFINFAMPLATSARHSSQNIAFNEVARQSIIADPDWCNGSYLNSHKFPGKGLSVARMSAHITYLSESALAQKFGRNLQSSKKLSSQFGVNFTVESYLHHQGIRFVDRFDPNTYLYLTKAMDYFDLIDENEGNLSNAYINANNVKVCAISFSDDWLFPPKELKIVTRALMMAGVNISSVIIESNRGHDSFLLPNNDLERVIENFINANYQNA
ncbi:MAG: homoserine O-acetyltransferase [Rickettsiales bacterium]|jgi:homoserine O-acetyltransferase/O-succinyltransferase|nr:homoserine O-acetyltransferase [Rickettsiales bacterium]